LGGLVRHRRWDIDRRTIVAALALGYCAADIRRLERLAPKVFRATMAPGRVSRN
jgi:hypothetical protein